MSTLKEDKTIFAYFSKSMDKKAGYGSGENLKKGEEEKYKELEKIKDWRKKLSNFWYFEFEWNGYNWRCIEEAYQAAKFGIDNYELFKKELENIVENNNYGLASRKLRKWKKLSSSELLEWNNKKNEIMKELLIIKFNIKEFSEILQLTKDSKLMHYMRPKYIHMKELEEIRITIM